MSAVAPAESHPAVRHTPTSVWVVDHEDWPRAYLIGELAELGFEASGFADPSGALIELARALAAAPDLVIVDLASAAIDPIDLAPFRRRRIPLIGIAGASAASSHALASFPWKVLLRRPCSIGEVIEAVKRLLRP